MPTKLALGRRVFQLHTEAYSPAALITLCIGAAFYCYNTVSLWELFRPTAVHTPFSVRLCPKPLRPSAS